MIPVLVPVLAVLAPQQDPGATPILARYQLAGATVAVTAEDVALDMAFHLRRKDEGKKICGHLVDVALVRSEAEQRRLMPSASEVREFWDGLKEQLRTAGRRPEDFAAVRNTPERDFLEVLAVQLAHEALVRRELELRAEEEVSPEMLQLWLQEARKRHQVVDDPDQLPIGAAVTVDGTEVPMLTLGKLLLRTAEDADRQRFIRQVVVLQTLEHLARAHDVQVAQADLRAEVAARRAEINADPRYVGLTYEQLLQSQGLTPELLLQSRVFRAQVLQKKLVWKLHPRADLQAELERDRQAVLDRVGPRRHVVGIFARALEQPNSLVPRDFPAALEHLAHLRRQIEAGKDFELLAKIESDDPQSKLRGGDLGWHHKKSTELPQAVLEAAFDLDVGVLSEPIQAADGCYLVRVTAEEPRPTDSELLDRMSGRLAQELTGKILTDAKIEFVE